MQQLISIIVPVYNEAPSLPDFCSEITKYTHRLPFRFECIFVDDGSSDDSPAMLRNLAQRRHGIRYIQLSRNFGKEAAVSAGLHAASGDAAIILDADLQHPPRLIRQFITKWQHGADVVVGVKHYSANEGWFKRFSSHLFYRMLGMISHTNITPHASDFRLVDRRVMNEFRNLREHNRMTRGLIDWLGFKRDYVEFVAPPRRHGERGYSYRKLINLAMNNFTAYSLVPLKLAGYVGTFILIFAGVLSSTVYIDQIMLHDPLRLKVTGTAMLALMLLFLVGVVLACLGLIALYIAHIHDEVVDRPLYVVRSHDDEATAESETIDQEPVKLEMDR
ncbi:MAG TPA: glycosyltransferase family 2 protein [Candidatus Saccharimonadales bacterium]|nr:glycosyltransferase family 2 protein [Candidatus Saccharimonadales bacterium]